MAFSKNVWDQVKAATADDLVSALKRDGYSLDPASKGAIHTYIKATPTGNKRVGIHWHPQKSYGPKLLQGLLSDLEWSEDDLKRVGLVKGKLKSMRVPIPVEIVPCDSCDRGIISGGVPCPKCGGTGHVEMLRPPSPIE